VITKFIERIRNDQNPVILGDGNQTRDFVYIEDVVEAVFNAMENRNAIGEVFNIGTGEPTRINDLANTLIRISNKKLKPQFASPQKGDIGESYADITKARKLLGYKPKYLLEQGLKLCVSVDN
jgi:UDP-glucose 4-epimerase